MRANIIEIIIDEINTIQGEIILTKAFMAEHDGNIESAFNSGDIMKEILAIMKSGKAKNDYNDRLCYMEGQIDAYIKLLNNLGYKL
jgi:hypothetical protein